MAAAGKISLDGSLQNSSCELQDKMRRLGSSSEDRPRLTGALSCLKSANEAGEMRRSSEPQQDSDAFSPISPPSGFVSPSSPLPPTSAHGRSISISVVPCSGDHKPISLAEDAFLPNTPPASRASKARTALPSQTPPASLPQTATAPPQHHPAQEQESGVPAGQPHRGSGYTQRR
ncbi:hypothetical protein OYC64_008122 [Pagothenia borchgrevinki]|uniref:Uncharacterized protein n=1 Tax=Pagothenia borchgrevinki TaxID=8213 RepID=A0ABD2GWG5_PAGBO